eukprot:2991759-Prymnesium_polylepis.1
MLGARPTSCSSSPAYFLMLSMVTLGLVADLRCWFPALSGTCLPHAGCKGPSGIHRGNQCEGASTGGPIDL